MIDYSRRYLVREEGALTIFTHSTHDTKEKAAAAIAENPTRRWMWDHQPNLGS